MGGLKLRQEEDPMVAMACTNQVSTFVQIGTGYS
jgi:hypothetical protein